MAIFMVMAILTYPYNGGMLMTYFLLAIILFNKKQKQVVENVIHRMVKRAVEMEGTISGEHGVGMVKRDYLHYEIGEPGVNAMRRVSSVYNILYFPFISNSFNNLELMLI